MFDNPMFKIYMEATLAAKEAAEAKDIETGDYWFPCGYATVNVPLNTKFGKFLKETNQGYKGMKGWIISYEAPTQKHSVNLEWARKFTEVLAEHNINASINSWID
jgi:hypothetical protein